MDKTVAIRPYRPSEASYVSYMQMKLYRDDYGFRPVFEYYITAGVADFLRDPAGSELWVAEKDGQIVGAIAAVRQSVGEAQLRWFVVEPAFQRLGIGSALVETALAFCREHGYRHVLLWTANILEPARRLYAKKGFVLTQTKENTDWRDDTVIEEKWEQTLS